MDHIAGKNKQKYSPANKKYVRITYLLYFLAEEANRITKSVGITIIALIFVSNAKDKNSRDILKKLGKIVKCSISISRNAKWNIVQKISDIEFRLTMGASDEVLGEVNEGKIDADLFKIFLDDCIPSPQIPPAYELCSFAFPPFKLLFTNLLLII